MKTCKNCQAKNYINKTYCFKCQGLLPAETDPRQLTEPKMKITTQTQYTVWIRPLGSKLWTIHTKPIYHSDRRLANNLASMLAIDEKVCAVVRELTFPGDPDPENGMPYVEIQDGEGRIERFGREASFIPAAERADIDGVIMGEMGGGEEPA